MDARRFGAARVERYKGMEMTTLKGLGCIEGIIYYGVRKEVFVLN